jgi:hypothetical protein
LYAIASKATVTTADVGCEAKFETPKVLNAIEICKLKVQESGRNLMTMQHE